MSPPISRKAVCKELLSEGLITEIQAARILKNGYRLKDTATSASAGTVKSPDPVDAIDLIASMNLNRADDPDRKLDEDALFEFMAQKWGVPYVKIDPLKLDFNLATSIIPKSFAASQLILPIAIGDGELTVAMANPFNQEALDDVARASRLRIKPVVSSKTDIKKLIAEFYGFKRSIAEAEVQFSGPRVDLGNLEHYFRLKSPEELPSNDQHIVNAVDHLFSYALDQRASDVHVEPKRDVSHVRMRIDGVLHTVYRLPKNVHPAIVSRIKNMSRLDMAEKRRPQDGRIKTNKGDIEVEIRVSLVPVAFGEKVVMRIMDPNILFQDLEKIGFTSRELIRYNRLIKMPHGIILVTGPTGSGKSTTLYSSLRDLSTPEINITTIEDPIEMICEDFNQIAVKPVLGISFANILRNILRQDPDIIMVGEMRDLETAENAIQAALTGHLVLSTLHTNDAPSSITRLLDLGIPAFLIQSTLIGIVAQRLVRTICKKCMESFPMDTTELSNLGIFLTGKKKQVSLHRGAGCHHCRYTGYRGRTAVFEVLQYTEAIQRMTRTDVSLEDIRAQAIKEGMSTLRESAVDKMLKGITTYQEVLRVTWENF